MKSPIYLSNALENLLLSLKEQLFDPSFSPFKRKMVVLPSELMKRYVMVHFAKDPSLNGVAGVQFVTLSQALRLFETKKIPHFITLSLLIEREVHFLLGQGLEEDRELLDYLSLPSPFLNQRLFPLVDQLSSLFMRYGIYGGEALILWEKKEGWQQKIWRALFSEGSPWNFPLKEFSSPRVSPCPMHLFGFSFLPKIYFNFFEQLESQFYLLSPCQYFWTDLDREEASYSLLGQLGKACRHLARLFEGSSFVREEYLLREGSYLTQIQNGLLNLEEVSYQEDDSIQLHAVSSKWREVELLFAYICSQLTDVEPKDILILAPDINDYFPFIQMIFGDKVDYLAYDVIGENQCSFFHGLMHLLTLDSLRFEKRAVLKLLQFPSFLKRVGIEQKEVKRIESWMEEASILWGLDRAHRQSYLKEELLEQSGRGTWQWGLELLLEELVTASSEHSTLDFADAELFGKWFFFIDSLKGAFAGLSQEKREISSWISEMKKLTESYFYYSEEVDSFFNELHSLSAIEGIFSFESFKRALKALFNKRENVQTTHLQAIHCASISIGAALPFQVICVLGMQEGAFPHLEERSSFGLMKSQEMLSGADEDRAHFLTLLLSARRSLWISYLNVDEKDGKEREPSSLIAGLKLKERRDEPFSLEKEQAPFFKEFYETVPFQEIKEEKEIFVDLKHLALFAKHPIQFYFNRRLHLYLERKEESDPEFVFSHLNRAILRKSKESAEKQWRYLPQGVFKELALQKVEEEREELSSALEEMGICPEEISSFELKLDCLKAQEKILPPLRFTLSEECHVTLFGKLPDLSPQGMLFHGNSHLKEIAKIWPLYLVYLHLFSEGKRELLLTKNGKRIPPLPHPEAALISYLKYYCTAQHQVSPCMPDWIPALIKGDEKELDKAMRLSFEASFFPDPYLEWIASRDPLPKASLLIERWSPLLKEIYASF